MATVNEPDYQRTVASDESGRLLDGTAIEIVREPKGRGEYRYALFDFDGTLSLIREGWQEIMAPMMMEFLLETPAHEPEEQLAGIVREFIADTTGKQTIYQMMGFAGEVRSRGGHPLDPAIYKREYVSRLMKHIADRRETLRSGRIQPEGLLVPGTLPLLELLVGRGVALYLASGTDVHYVREEAELLGIDGFFGPHIYGALEDHAGFSKAQVIERILEDSGEDPRFLLGFGDGYVEIDNVKSAGGTAIGVASDEAAGSDAVEPWKRRRLIGVGADIVVGNFREAVALIGYLFPGERSGT
jgi:phosphoglycolate phosphatase